MKCPWCSNPEGMPKDGILLTEKEWLDDSCCPHGAVRDRTLDRSACGQCADRACVNNRRQKGIRLSCREYTVEEMVRECVRAKPMFFEGGGVTLTGGEVSMQFPEAERLLIRLGEEGIHRAIETNGSHPELARWIPHVDQWIMDVKHYDEKKHIAWTGVSNRWVLHNLEQAARLHPNVLIRIPLIPGVNDRREDADGFARLLKDKARGANVQAEFLLYHEFGKTKWEQCGKPYPMKVAKPEPGIREYFEETMARNGITCVRT